jgi:hypothetical protein
MRVLERLVKVRRVIIPRNVRKSSEEVQSSSAGDVNSPHRDALQGSNRRPNNIETSSRLTVISPMGKWNECVSGRHQSRNAAISEESYWKCVMCCLART